jgi:hypothetical protein
MPASNPEHRRALALLADAPNGMTEAALMANGVRPQTVADLVNAGYASESLDHAIAGGRRMEAVRVHITEAGRRVPK